MSKSSEALYGIGMFGALVYHMQYAQGFSQVMWGLLKSVLWPAFMVYDILSLLQV